ncbi:helix-turn-helix domain-containing protein [Aureivirga sp. CE67]|uniref:helix-turn-helix domain-containing protein n=1 Tax=Aureivirga sp. CE67 TaxID=1788983 RepID=UPI0018CB91D7|nr:AraC family transcriptional regulator [Aureivirga sp. CE67]
MLQTIQIIAILQGLFLLLILIRQKKEFKPVNFWLLIGLIISIVGYAIGDDDYNLFVKDAHWFFFYDLLFITFFFLFIKYQYSDKKKFDQRDFVYFIPYLIFTVFEIFENVFFIENAFTSVIMRIPIMLVISYYLVNTIYITYKKAEKKWVLYFLIPYTIIFLVEKLADILYQKHDSIPFIESYGIIGLSVLLFYIIIFNFIINPKSVLPKPKLEKYKSSNLKKDTIETEKQRILDLFEKEKIFKNKEIKVNDVAKQLGISRQQLSEILNLHLGGNFQDILNKYRVEEFINYLQDEKYKNYTLLGIAFEVGFSSKTSFYTCFKKEKGMTPNAFKKSLEKKDDNS